ncbi:MAG: histidine phosphatase family protein [Planctomycetota bacterium]|nr:MAG: histidine phosphatase family protein [Planctomycetota bacterium]
MPPPPFQHRKGNQLVRTLMLMRHAKSSWKEPGMADHDRPLNRRGTKAATFMGWWLKEQGLEPDVILASTARRVQETVHLMRQEGWAADAVVLNERRLYLAYPDTILECVAGLSTEWNTAMAVGHNPGMADLVSTLAGQVIEFPTAAIAVFQSPAEDWCTAVRSNDWELLHLWKPRELEAS